MKKRTRKQGPMKKECEPKELWNKETTKWSKGLMKQGSNEVKQRTNETRKQCANKNTKKQWGTTNIGTVSNICPHINEHQK